MNKRNLISSLEFKDDLEDIISVGESEKENRNELKKLLSKNRGHSDYGRQLTYNKKLEKELDSLPDKASKYFRKSLDEYKFNLEVYVPHSMVISKKEYVDKNYMLNHLVKSEDIIKSKKKQIFHISKETRKFAHQYEFVREENMPHQMKYLSNIENMYKNKGYNTTGINYKKDDNIFNPSFLLDSKYGNNSKTDAVKYGQNNYKKDYKVDKWLLTTFDDYIQNKNKGVHKRDSNKNIEETLEDDDEKQKMLAQIKKDLDEQNKIKNMSPKLYSSYSKSIKKEIESIKNTINNVDNLNDFFNKKSFDFKNINLYNLLDLSKNTTNENFNKNNDINKVNNNDEKNIKQKKIIDFNSNIFLSSKGMKNYKNKNQFLPDLINPQKDNKDINNNEIISQNKSDKKEKNIVIPKILIKESLNRNKNRKKEKESTYLSDRKLKEIQKEKQLTQLYDKLYNRKSNSIFPYKQISNYFTKYTHRKIPLPNTDRGSNIHGLVEELQNKINDNNFAGFAKLNNNIKNNMNFNYKNEENQNKKLVDEDYINKLDNKILKMHYGFTDKLLSNKNDHINIE